MLGPVDGFDEDEAEREGDEGGEVRVGLLAAEREALEALELADRPLDAGACPVERLGEEGGPGLGRVDLYGITGQMPRARAAARVRPAS